MKPSSSNRHIYVAHVPYRLKSSLVWRMLLFCMCMIPLACLDAPSTPSSVYTQQEHWIIGGKPDLRHPEVGALTRNQRTFCTGTLIARRVVLTAAHCVDAALQYAPTQTIQFRIDYPDANQPKGFRSAHYDFNIRLFTNHPLWKNSVQNGGDIGIGILKKPIADVTPMPPNYAPLTAQSFARNPLFLGYGLIQSVPKAVSPNRKYAVELPVARIQTDRFVHQAPGKSVCHGDSGGPAIVQLNGVKRVVGVNSYVTAARVPGTNRSRCDGAGVSMRTDTFARFIQSFLDVYGDGPLACQAASECGSCGQCTQKTCKAKQDKPNVRNCKACAKDTDCKGGACIRFPSGSRCLEPCSAQKCCPAGHYCASLPTQSGTQSVCLPRQMVCPPLSCTRNQDCSPSERCEHGTCQPERPARSKTLCQPCTQDTECGAGHLCLGLKGHKRCAQACGKGGTCPADTQCQVFAPGLPRQCIPVQGACQIPCQFSSQCQQGYTCQEGVCVSQKAGEFGEQCDPAPCKPPLRCTPTRTGKRCLQRCGVPSGQPGSRCNNQSCHSSHQCYTLGQSRQLCLMSCSSDADCTKRGGGSCQQRVCLCVQDSDCGKGFFCNQSSRILGACAPVPNPPQPKCPTGQSCRAIQEYNVCLPTQQGERTMGQSCDALHACKEGFTCVPRSDGTHVCMESCEQTQTCTLGGTCQEISNTLLCLCQNDKECPKGRRCRLSIRGRAGYCEAQGERHPCVHTLECPAGLFCVDGQCQNSPHSERPSEAHSETFSETSLEPSTQEPTAESTKESAPILDAGEQKDTRPLDTPSGPNKGCGGCSTQKQMPQPISWLWVLIFFVVSFRSKNTSHPATQPTTPASKSGLYGLCGLALLVGLFSGCPTPIPSCKQDQDCNTGQKCVQNVCQTSSESPSREHSLSSESTSERTAPKERPSTLEPPTQKDTVDAGEPIQDQIPPEPLKPLPSFQAPARSACQQTHDPTCCEIAHLSRTKELFTHNNSYLGSVYFALHPDGTHLASVNHNARVIRVWKIKDWTLQYTLLGHQGSVRSVAFSPDKKHLASSSSDSTIRIWDLTTGTQVRILKGHVGYIYSIRYNKDGTRLVSGGSDRTVRIWNPTDGTLVHTLNGHTNAIRKVAYSSLGTVVASSGYDSTIRIWDLTTGKALHILKPHKGPIEALAFHPNGTTLASGGGYQDKTIQLHDTSSGKRLHTWQAHSHGIYDLAFNASGTLLASVSRDKRLRIWDTQTRSQKAEATAGTSTVYGVAFHADTQHIYTVSSDQTIRAFTVNQGKQIAIHLDHHALGSPVAWAVQKKWAAVADVRQTEIGLWDTTTGAQYKTLKGHSLGVRAVAFDTQETQLASGSTDTTVRLWDPKTGQVLHTLKGHTMPVTSVAFAPNASILASGSWDGSIRLWNAKTGQSLRILQGHTSIITQIAFSPTGTRIASSSLDRTARIWDVQTGKLIHTFNNHNDWLYGITWSPQADFIATSGWSREIHVTSVANGQTMRVLSGHKGVVRALHWSPTGPYLASASYDKTLLLWNTNTGEIVQKIQPRNQFVTHVHFAPNGEQLIAGTWDGNADIWTLGSFKAQQTTPVQSALHTLTVSAQQDYRALGYADHSIHVTQRGKRVWTLTQHTGAINSLAFRYDARLLASGSDDRSVRVWDLQTGSSVRTLKGHQERVVSVHWNRETGQLLSGSWDGTIRLWDLKTGRTKRTFQVENSRVLTARWSPDGKWLTAGTSNGSIWLWDAQSGQHVATLSGHTSGVSALVFSSNSARLYSGSYDKTIKVWDVPHQRLIRTLSGAKRGINRLFLTPDLPAQILAGTTQGVLYAWNLHNGQLSHHQAIANGLITGLHAAPKQTQTLLVATESKGIVQVHYNSTHRTLGFYRNPVGVNALAYSPQSTHILAGSDSRQVRTYRPSDWKHIRTNYTHYSAIRGLSIRPNNKHVASVSDDERLHITQLSDGKAVRTLQAHSEPVRSVAYAPNGKWIATASEDHTVKIWTSDTIQVQYTLQGHTDTVTDLSFHPKKPLLLSASLDGSIRLWDLQTGNSLHVLQAHKGGVWSVQFRPDAQEWASIGADGRLVIWDATANISSPPKKYISLKGLNLRYSPNSHWLAVRTSDGTVRIYGTRQYTYFKRIFQKPYTATALTWSPDSRQLLIGDQHGHVAVFQCK